ncbi:MAG: hypothetical protein HYZ25_00570 [Chloroflexi bacterium]|nr:hypothetical protein [Chloroflexota bacterium]
MKTKLIKPLKENILLLTGWLLFFALLKVFEFSWKSWGKNSMWHVWVSYLGVSDARLSVSLSFIVIVVGVGYLAFALSWQLIVFPTLRRGNLINASVSYLRILDWWLTYCWYYLLYSLPIVFIILFLPVLFLSVLNPIAENTQDVIIFILQTALSLWLYRKTTLSCLSELSPVKTEPQPNPS